MLSLAHLTVMKADPVELIEIGARAGFDAVGLRVAPPLPTDTIIPVVGDLPLQRRIKKHLSDAGIALLDVEAFWLMPGNDLQRMKIAVEVGAELGAKHVLIVGNDPDRSRMMENFIELCGHCETFGLRPMLEFIPYSHIRSLPDAYSFLQTSGVTNAGLLVDALHLSRSGGDPKALEAYPKELFSYLHMCDAPLPPPTGDEVRVEARGRRLYPGEGDLPLAEFIRAVGKDAPIAIEAPNARHAGLSLVEQATLAADATKRLLARTFGQN